MDLPRFTQGAVGNLTYAHLNEAFELLDKLRPLLTESVIGQRDEENFILARISGEMDDNGFMPWVEVVPKPSTSNTAKVVWIDRVGGRKSGSQGSENYLPCIVPPSYESDTESGDPVELPQGSVCVLRAIKRKEGRPLWIVVSSAATSEVFPAKIMGRYQIGDGVWSYDWDEVEAPDWTTPQNGRKGRRNGTEDYPEAVNGAEQVGIVGAGGSGPSGGTIKNAPIANGIVVMMNLSGGPWFSLGNTLEVSC
jgi:hypothetical protein